MSDFVSEEKNGIHIITCPTQVESIAGSLEIYVKAWLIVDSNIHILDFKNVFELKQNAYRPFILFNQGLKANSKRLFCMNMSTRLLPQISQDGLSSVFEPVKTIEEAIQKVKAAARPSIDVEFINPFILATQNVLEIQAQTKAVAGKPYVKQSNELLPMEIAGIISLNNPSFNGSISLCFKAKVFLKIYENMLGERHTEINSECEDAAAELLNIIFGQAKTILNGQKGYALDKALPTILVGEKLRMRYTTTAPVIILPFESTAGTFYLSLAVQRS